MSSADAPLLSALNRQRRAIELSHRAVTQGLAVQRRVVRSLVDSLDAQRDASERTSAVVDGALETSLLLADSTVPGGGSAYENLGGQLEQQLDALHDLQDATWTAYARAMEDGLFAYERFADVHAEAVDASFDAAIQGTDWMSDEVAGMRSRGGDAIEVEVEVDES